MKLFSIIALIIAVGLTVFNVTRLDFNAGFHGENKSVCMAILASLCAALVVLILNISKQIEAKSKLKK